MQTKRYMKGKIDGYRAERIDEHPDLRQGMTGIFQRNIANMKVILMVAGAAAETDEIATNREILMNIADMAIETQRYLLRRRSAGAVLAGGGCSRIY